MKARTVIILVICGALLLTVAAFGIFFARGGEVIYPSYYFIRGGGNQPFSADKNVVDEIAKLHFIFQPSEELNVEFRGIGVSPKTVLFSEHGKATISEYVADIEITIEGWVNRSFPSGTNFVSIDEEEFRDALFKEIQSRITLDAKFELDTGSLWGDKPYQVKKRPEKQ